MTKKIEQQWQVPDALNGERLDKALTHFLPDYSRAMIKSWIDAGCVTVNGQCLKPKAKLQGGEILAIEATLPNATPLLAQEIPLEILWEDEHLCVINKPAGLVVHPGAGNPDQTLVNALLFHFPNNRQIPRAGLIHRLDKDTSGCLLIAKTPEAYQKLIQMMQARDISRQYIAVVHGKLVAGKTIDAPIARHHVNRLRMAVVQSGKSAVTHVRVLERFSAHTLLALTLETGRTHQIRVHLAHEKHPIVGDPLYNPRRQSGLTQPFNRQALHAETLSFEHPITQESVVCRADYPNDIQNLLQLLRDPKKS